VTFHDTSDYITALQVKVPVLGRRGGKAGAGDGIIILDNHRTVN